MGKTEEGRELLRRLCKHHPKDRDSLGLGAFELLRGLTAESVIAQHLSTVRPMHMEFVEPSKRYAHVIIPEGRHNEVGIDLVIQKIRSLVPVGKT